MNKNILFVFEGERTEKLITDNLRKYFINENSVITCAFCSNIYNLYKEVSEDEYFDTFILLKNKQVNEKILEKFISTDFGEIYLFFDFDGHTSGSSDYKIIEILNFFNEETDKGKIFISYPMVEALKHYSPSINFQYLKVKARIDINTKKKVHNSAKREFLDFTRYTIHIWKILIVTHLKKANYIVNNKYYLPRNSISQNDIFSKQKLNYLDHDSTIAVLSSFPLFLLEYYGLNNLLGRLRSKKNWSFLSKRQRIGLKKMLVWMFRKNYFIKKVVISNNF